MDASDLRVYTAEAAHIAIHKLCVPSVQTVVHLASSRRLVANPFDIYGYSGEYSPAISRLSGALRRIDVMYMQIPPVFCYDALFNMGFPYDGDAEEFQLRLARVYDIVLFAYTENMTIQVLREKNDHREVIIFLKDGIRFPPEFPGHAICHGHAWYNAQTGEAIGVGGYEEPLLNVLATKPQSAFCACMRATERYADRRGTESEEEGSEEESSDESMSSEEKKQDDNAAESSTSASSEEDTNNPFSNNAESDSDGEESLS